MEIEQYLRGLAEQLVHELEPTESLKQFTENSKLLGDYAEAAIRRLIRRVVHPMHVSTGAVLDYPMPRGRSSFLPHPTRCRSALPG